MKYKCLVAFAIGGAIGAVSTWYYAKKHFEAIANEEIESVKSTFSKLKNEETEQTPPENKESPEVSEQNAVEYAEQVSRHGYTPYSDAEVRDTAVTAHKHTKAPYVISPEEFGDRDEYDRITLWHHPDGVLSDEDDGIVEDADDLVGPNYQEHFGEYDDNAVYVRNDRLKVDYEILLDMRKYSEILKNKPYLMEG